MQMIYFCLVAVATPSPPIDATVTAQGSFCIDACCPETAIPKLIFGPDDRFGEGITMMQNNSRLTCSGEFEAADVRIAGTNTTVADLISRMSAQELELNLLRQEMAAVKAFVGMMPPAPPASPPPQIPPASPPPPWCVMSPDTPLAPFHTGYGQTTSGTSILQCAQWCMDIDAQYGCERTPSGFCGEVTGPITSLGYLPGWGNWGCFRSSSAA